MGFKTQQSPFEISINQLEKMNDDSVHASNLDDEIKMQFHCQTRFAMIKQYDHKLFDIMLERNAKKNFDRKVIHF